jgi:DNA-directed RNA polymerase subunit F
MDEIMASIKYVPSYVLVDRARNEEKDLREEMEKFYNIELEKEKKVKQTLVNNLLKKQLSVEEIAEITGLTPEEITIIKENKNPQE